MHSTRVAGFIALATLLLAGCGPPMGVGPGGADADGCYTADKSCVEVEPDWDGTVFTTTYTNTCDGNILLRSCHRLSTASTAPSITAEDCEEFWMHIPGHPHWHTSFPNAATGEYAWRILGYTEGPVTCRLKIEGWSDPMYETRGDPPGGDEECEFGYFCIFNKASCTPPPGYEDYPVCGGRAP